MQNQQLPVRECAMRGRRVVSCRVVSKGAGSLSQCRGKSSTIFRMLAVWLEGAVDHCRLRLMALAGGGLLDCPAIRLADS